MAVLKPLVLLEVQIHSRVLGLLVEEQLQVVEEDHDHHEVQEAAANAPPGDTPVPYLPNMTVVECALRR